METDELVDHLSAIATTVTKEVMSWLTRTPLLWPCTVDLGQFAKMEGLCRVAMLFHSY